MPDRVDLKHIVHENTYRIMDSAQLEEMFVPKAGVRLYADYMKTFYDRKYNSDFSKEMTRSVEMYLKDFEG